jgi:hypothetical protein
VTPICSPVKFRPHTVYHRRKYNRKGFRSWCLVIEYSFWAPRNV